MWYTRYKLTFEIFSPILHDSRTSFRFRREIRRWDIFVFLPFPKYCLVSSTKDASTWIGDIHRCEICRVSSYRIVIIVVCVARLLSPIDHVVGVQDRTIATKEKGTKRREMISIKGNYTRTFEKRLKRFLRTSNGTRRKMYRFNSWRKYSSIRWKICMKISCALRETFLDFVCIVNETGLLRFY